MPAITIRYRKTLSLALSNNAINFTESSIVGHRVQIPVPVDYLNTFFVWERASGSPRPIGHFLSEVNSIKFMDVLIGALNKLYVDIDGSAGGLNYSSYILDSNYDSRVRCDGIGANDIIMAYILYKCYGASAAPTMDIIYNLEDAQKMITSEQVAAVIIDALSTDEQLAVGNTVDKGGVDAMFRYILATNPLRYFKADGTQIDGLFETNFACGDSDPPGTGPWGLIENDIIELRLNFTFPKDVTHTSSDDLGGNRTVVIPAGSNFGIRLQLLATDTAVGATSKQSAAAAAAAIASGQQQAAAAVAAANASITAAMAEEQRQAAAYRTTIEEIAYTNAVNENARQAIASNSAHAIATAALAALQNAIVSGSTVADIQSLRAAATAASAVAARATIIAMQASTLLQNAENTKAAAEQVLADFETAAANAAAISATANSISFAAAQAKALVDAATIAASHASAIQATDPTTKILTDAENKLLDPQTLISLRLTLNIENSKTLDAWTSFVSASNSKNITQRKLSNTTMDLNCAILAGKSEGEINILQGRLMSLTETLKLAVQAVSTTTTALIVAQSNEKSVLDEYTVTATQAATLASLISKSALTHDTSVLATTSATVTQATTSNTTAQAALITAQNALTTAITDGSTMSSVSILRTAVINKTTLAKTTADALARANIANITAQSSVDSLTIAVASADAKIISVISDNTALVASYTSSLTSLQTYEEGLITSVDVSISANQLNNAHLRVLNTSEAADLAVASYDLAKRQYDIAASTQIPDISLLSKLNSYVLYASTKKDATAAALALAQTDYTTSYAGIIENSNSKSILNLAATNFTTSVANAKANTMALTLYDIMASANEAQNYLDTAQTQYTLAQNSLNSAITASSTIDDIRVLNIALGVARDKYINATSALSAAQQALTVAHQGVTLSVDSEAILTNVALLQHGQQVIVKANALVADITTKYEDAAAVQASLFAAKETYTIASAALVHAVKAGQGLIEIIPLQANLHKASIELTRLTFFAAGKNLAVTNALTLGTQDSIAKAKIDSSTVIIEVAIIVAKVNALNIMLIKLNQDELLAKTAFDNANEQLIVAKLALDTSITSGNSISDIQVLQTTVQTATNLVVSTQVAYTKATDASTQANIDVNALTVEETTILDSSTKTPLVDAIAALTTANAEITLQGKKESEAIMAASVISQTTVMITAQKNLTAANTAAATAQTTYDSAKAALDAAIAAGSTLDGIKDVLLAEQKASADLANAQAVVSSATNAYTNAQTAVAATTVVANIVAAIALAAGI
jgi:hypothetical protein